ncbi:MAG: hypothetical protein U1A78_39410 [Polyangia bacterium]
MLLATRIARLAPSGASHYQLRLRMPDGSVRQYPPAPGSFYSVGAAPGPIPAGRYTVLFFDSALRSLQTESAEVVIESLAASLRGATENPEVGPGQHGEPMPSSQLAPAAVGRSDPPAGGVTSLSREELARRLRAEPDPFRRQQLLDAHQEARDTAFIQNSQHIREVGEIFLVNRMMRREMMAMQESMVDYQRQEYAQIEQMKQALPALWEIQAEVLQHVEKQLGKTEQAAPTPNYVGLGMDALATVQVLGQAIVDRVMRPAPSQQESPPTADKPGTRRG